MKEPEKLLSLREQLDQRVFYGFHTQLNQAPSEYIRDHEAIFRVDQGGLLIKDGIRVLVEPRIPFLKQLELLGLAIDPSVFYEPHYDPEKPPYAVSLTVIGVSSDQVRKGQTLQQIVTGLPELLRPATPLEGITPAFQNTLDQSPVAMAGGFFRQPINILACGNTTTRMLCLEYFLGQPRITHVRADSHDGMVGVLAAHK